MKKLINDPTAVVPEMMEGLAHAYPGLVLIEGETIAVRADADELRAAGKVALISGGGAGHEPAHAGYVGDGMLTAAVSGDVFASPSTDAVLSAIRAVGGKPGVLLIVKNYTGDRLNFGLAAEIARTEGIPVEIVTVADDVALAQNGETAGRRGIAGTVFVHKIAGAAAEAGLPLAAVAKEAADAAALVGTMGLALSPCIVPAAGRPAFELANDELELGLGIHGEAGVSRRKLAPIDDLVDGLLEQIVSDRGIKPGDRVALLANNLGGTPTMEMAIVFRRAIGNLTRRGIAVERAWFGTFLTAIEMAGCSLSLMKLDDTRISRLDAATKAPAWPAQFIGRVNVVAKRVAATASQVSQKQKSGNSVPADAADLTRVIREVGKAWLDAETLLTEMDGVVGDGDLGLSLARGARAVERDLENYQLSDRGALFKDISATLRRAMGGTSGALYAVALLRAGAVFYKFDSVTPATWAAALIESHRAISELGGAKAGDRTMLDALVPAANAFAAGIERGDSAEQALASAVKAAREGATKTKDMMPRRGRASYLGERALGHVDPGAEAVALTLETIARALPARTQTKPAATRSAAAYR